MDIGAFAPIAQATVYARALAACCIRNISVRK